MIARHTPTPWEHDGCGLIYGMPPGDGDEAPFVADVISERECAAFGIVTDAERANAALIVRACNAHDGFVDALKQALEALNTAPRFRAGGKDSYRIASAIQAALKNAGVNPYAR
jgi:hypothetical protein